MTTRRQTIDFLIAFDHDTRTQISLDEFWDTRRALEAYVKLEEQYRNNPRVEVVLLGSDSIDTIKVTHSNYFDDTVDALNNLIAHLERKTSPSDQTGDIGGGAVQATCLLPGSSDPQWVPTTAGQDDAKRELGHTAAIRPHLGRVAAEGRDSGTQPTGRASTEMKIERAYINHQLGAEIDVAVSAGRSNEDLFVPVKGLLVRESTVTALSRSLVDHLGLEMAHYGWNPDLEVAYIAYAGVDLALQGDNGWALFRNLEVVNMENLRGLLLARNMAGGEDPDVLIGKDIIDCGALLLFEQKFVFTMQVGPRLEPVVPMQASVLEPSLQGM